MNIHPKKKKTVNSEDETRIVNAGSERIEENTKKEAPLAPFDPRHKKPGESSLQANEDPLNGVNE
jgi:hypothetical protein